MVDPTATPEEIEALAENILGIDTVEAETEKTIDTLLDSIVDNII